MTKVESVESINQEIQELKASLNQVKGTKTEVYTRIVGYYRSVKNWNKGKRDEFNHRVTFSADSQTPTTQDAARYEYFFKNTCPNCPPVRSLLTGLTIQGKEINVEEDEGFQLAAQKDIMVTPTAIFYDKQGREMFRTSSPQTLQEKLTSLGPLFS